MGSGRRIALAVGDTPGHVYPALAVAEALHRADPGVQMVLFGQGERGVRLSGGESQRISIARALYHDPAVLVFDEATSALDPGTEHDLADAMDALRGRRTLIVVAHRVTTIQRADRVVLLRDGRVEGTGSYAELARASAAFSSFAMPARENPNVN